MNNVLTIDDKVLKLTKEVENEIKEEIQKCDELCLKNTKKVLSAFIENNVSAQAVLRLFWKGILQKGLSGNWFHSQIKLKLKELMYTT